MLYVSAISLARHGNVEHDSTTVQDIGHHGHHVCHQGGVAGSEETVVPRSLTHDR